jgi:hypothetical protein
MDDVPVFNQQVVRLYDEGKYKEAAAIAEKALALAERTLGKDQRNEEWRGESQFDSNITVHVC